jgi:hypothetical protein
LSFFFIKAAAAHRRQMVRGIALVEPALEQGVHKESALEESHWLFPKANVSKVSLVNK